MNACTHPRSIPGIDSDWCPDCEQVIKPAPSKSAQRLTEIHAQIHLSTPLFNPISVSTHPAVAYGNEAAIHHDIYEVPSHGKRYYRYVVTQGHRVIESRHIPGGNINNPKAKQRAARVRSWIEAGMSPSDIIAFIKKW